MEARRVPLRELLIHLRPGLGDGGPIASEWVCRSQPSYPAPLRTTAAAAWRIELEGEGEGSPDSHEWLQAGEGFSRVCIEASGEPALRWPAVREFVELHALGRRPLIVRRSSVEGAPSEPAFPLRVAWPRGHRPPGEELQIAVARGLLELTQSQCTFVHLRGVRRALQVSGDVLIVHLRTDRRMPGDLWHRDAIVVDEGFDPNTFYMRLFDGWPLDRAAQAATPASGRPPVLIIGPGAETRYLPDRLIAAAAGLSASELATARAIPLESIGVAPSDSQPRLVRAKRRLLSALRSPASLADDTLEMLDEASAEAPDWGARVDALSASRASGEALRRVERITDPDLPDDVEPEPRVTKAYFHRAGEELLESVVVGSPVALRIRVVPKRDAGEGGLTAPLLDSVMRQMFVGEATLDVRLFLLDTDWSAPRREAKLTVPRLGPSRECVDFELQPRRAGDLPLRVGIYARDVLLQSFSAWLSVHADGESRESATPRYVLDYVADGDFELLDELDERAPSLSLFINRAENTHWIGAVGDQREPITLTLSDQRVLPLIEPARKLLEDVHRAFVAAAGDPAPAWLEGELVRLACRGRELHAHVFTEFEQRGRFIERADRLGVARIDRDAPQLPWSLLYDYPLLTDPELVELCPKARERGPISVGAQIPCLGDTECRSRLRGEKHACPYGFWGFRHRIEVNLGHNPSAAELDPVAWRNLGEQVVRASGVRYAYSPWIDDSREHAAELKGASGPLQLRISDDGDDIRHSLREPEDELFYLLCHGRHKEATREFYLEFVAQDRESRLSLAELQPDVFGRFEPHSFVVILNACESAAVGPGTVHQMLDALRQLGAVAIIGTEVEVERRYALSFGPKLLAGLVGGVQLGELMYSLRWAGLRESLDPSGLVYTAYGPGSLRVLSSSDR